MSHVIRHCSRPLVALLGVFLVAGCASVQNTTLQVASLITPYRVEVIQGNFVSREQVEALRPGLTRVQVREVLGTPLIESLFHADRWDYVFTLKRDGVATQLRRLTVFFKDDRLERFEGDPMPSETEFAETLTPARGARGKALPLEAEPAPRDAGPAAQAPAAASAAANTPAPGTSARTASPGAARVYPPLEAGASPAR